MGYPELCRLGGGIRNTCTVPGNPGILGFLDEISEFPGIRKKYTVPGISEGLRGMHLCNKTRGMRIV